MTTKHKEKIALALYEQGKFKEAFEQFMILATVHKDVYSMQHIATMYATAEGVPLDYEQSIAWDKKAIELGNTSCLANLAITFRMIGDIKLAKYWFEQSIEAGYADSALPLAKLYMVSDKEVDTIVTLLKHVLSDDNVCLADMKEAKELLQRYDKNSTRL